MTELLLVVCLLSAPTQCRENSLVFTDETSPMECMMDAQTELAKWASTHPKHRIQSWKCQTVSSDRDA